MPASHKEPTIHDTATQYQIHPAIGIARLGNSPDQILLSPEAAGQLPLACNPDGSLPGGREIPSHEFRDASGMIKRQAARFKVLVYDQAHPDGRELKKGDIVVGQGTSGPLLDIEWTVWLANKKAGWYQFRQLEGEHGYAPDHPRRNADVVDPDARQNLIIDPGPQTVSTQGPRKAAGFGRGEQPYYAQTFPPPLNPKSIDTLGHINTLEEDNSFRLIVRGGYGHSGCWKSGPQDPHISSYANNDGWFDDTSDGPVTARLVYWDATDQQVRYQNVQESAWAIVAYPAFAPQIVSMITMNDVLEDLYIRQFAADTYLYGRPDSFSEPEKIDTPGALQLWRDFSGKEYNQAYYPLFWRDIWPILTRPYYMQWVTAVLGSSNAAHDIVSGDFAQSMVSTPPRLGPDGQVSADPYRGMRIFVYDSLRKPGEENLLYNERAAWNIPGGSEQFAQFSKELMPLLCGDNPITNSLVSKFLRLTDTQLFLLRQWALGKFINEKQEAWDESAEVPASLLSAADQGMRLSTGMLGNVLGGAFCPGGEVGWIMRNPAIWEKPYRLRINPLYVPNLSSATVSDTPGVTNTFTPPALTLDGDITAGLQPGDLTKYMALPWQSDFNECSTQKVDVTYEQWNRLYPPAGGQLADRNPVQMDMLWWPWHRPMQVFFQVVTQEGTKTNYAYHQRDWAMGIPQTHAGDLKMVTAWAELGFVVNNYNDPDNGQPFVVVVQPDDPAYQWFISEQNKPS